MTEGAVMAGLVPDIHAVVQRQTSNVLVAVAQGFVKGLQSWRRTAAWMAGTSPAMTESAGL